MVISSDIHVLVLCLSPLRLCQGCTNFLPQKSRRHLILGFRKVTRSKVHIQRPHILGTAAQDLVATTTRHLGILHLFLRDLEITSERSPITGPQNRMIHRISSCSDVICQAWSLPPTQIQYVYRYNQNKLRLLVLAYRK